MACNRPGTFQNHMEALPKLASPLSPLTPFHPEVSPITSLSQTRRTRIMAILNLTPDSFSDGGLHVASTASSGLDHLTASNPVQSQPIRSLPSDVATSILPYLNSLPDNPPVILDIGGQSTRPHAPQISSSEEQFRILPTISYIRSLPQFASLPISVDTYNASTASAAIAAGANIINDVSGGTMDRDMLPTIAKLGCTIVLMHMRGTPDTMTKMTDYPEGVVKGVATDLLARVAAAEAAGIRRWRIMIDPGIGFAKNEAQNLELLRHFRLLRGWQGLRGLPWVVGASRKGFIGKAIGVKEPRERGWGTAAVVTVAVRGGADVVRVHDVKEMGQVVRMSEALWRFEKEATVVVRKWGKPERVEQQEQEQQEQEQQQRRPKPPRFSINLSRETRSLLLEGMSTTPMQPVSKPTDTSTIE